jgi:hypothetical protein
MQDSTEHLQLSPAAFTPAVQRCAAARSLALRQLAARAMAPLVAPEEQLPACLALIQRLPQVRPLPHATGLLHDPPRTSHHCSRCLDLQHGRGYIVHSYEADRAAAAHRS